MIITRTPFRISFAGGGSDLPSFYRKEGGAVLSTTIDKYMYIVIHPYFDHDKIQLKYSKTELVDDVDKIQHPIFREVLKMYGLTGIEVSSIADIPAGTGMGSSSSFTVGLLNAVRAYIGKFSSAGKLASMACDVEINRVGSPIGKQDQYAAAFGGMNFITFNPDDTVKVEKVLMKNATKQKLENNLLLVFIGGKHSANQILSNQSKAIKDDQKFLTQKRMVVLADELRESIQKDAIDDFGAILDEGWKLKRSLVNGITSPWIDEIYEKGLRAGAIGGKLLGAGGAGFILFYCPQNNQESFKRAMDEFKIMPVGFDNFGSQVIYVGDKTF